MMNLFKRFAAALTAAVITASILASCGKVNEPDLDKDPLPTVPAETSDTLRAEVTAIEMEEETVIPSETETEPETEAPTETKTETSPETRTETTTIPITTPTTLLLTVTPPETETTLPTETAVPGEAAAPQTGSAVTVNTEPPQTTSHQTTAAPQTTTTAASTTSAPVTAAAPTVNKVTGKTIITRPYSYYKMTADQQALYDDIYNHAINLDEQFDLAVPTEPDDIAVVYEVMVNEEIELFYLDSKFYYSGSPADKMKLRYIDTPSNIRKKRKDMDAATQEILSKVTSGMSDYDMVKLFHDEIIKNVTYDTSGENNVYGAFVNKRTMCQGYAGAFLRLCNLTGIPALSITGQTNEPHMWNMVKIDGEWYHIDLTWDDPDKEDAPEFARYDYFGLDTATIKTLRTIDHYDYALPEAASDRYNYFVYNKLVATDYEGMKIMLKNEMYKAAKNREYGVQVRCASSELTKEVITKMLESTNAEGFDLLEEINTAMGGSYIETNSIYYSADEGTRVIKIFLKYV